MLLINIRKLLIFFIFVLIPSFCLAESIDQFSLANGLKVIVIPNKKVPAVSYTVWYKVGAADEKNGKTGIAHFLEHMMFKGTKNIPKGMFSKLISKQGAENNAFTSFDYTAYYENISKTKLELAIKLEADRMQNLLLDEEELIKEREVIIEERRMRIEDDPAAQLDEQMRAALYQNHPYGRPLIGWHHEMAKLDIKDVKDWYDSYYKPNNAMIIISGDITKKEIRPLIEKYYAGISAGKNVVRERPQEPIHIAPVYIKLDDKRVARSQIYRYYLMPFNASSDKKKAFAALILSALLGEGNNSSLYLSLVRNQKLAIETTSEYDMTSIDRGMFAIAATSAEGVKLESLEKAIDYQLKQMKDSLVSESNLQRIKNNLIASNIYGRENLKTMAFIYGTALATGLDLSYIENWQENINAVSREDIKQVAQEIFNINNSVTGYLDKQY